jgi:hypothetical protein
MGVLQATPPGCILLTTHRLSYVRKYSIRLNRLTLTGFGITLEAQHNLRCTVPSRCNVFCHVSSIFLWVNREPSSQSKITNLQFTVGIDQQISGLQISMEDVGRVDVFQSAEDLVDEGLEMCVGEGLAGSNDGSKIAFHEFCIRISIYPVFVSGRCIPS